MAKELAHFKNFAKLKDTKVAFNDITVIAGKPGTGKSYVMKMMYALDEALYKASDDLKDVLFQLKNLKEQIKKLQEDKYRDNDILKDKVSKVSQTLKNLAKKLPVEKEDYAKKNVNLSHNKMYEDIIKAIFIDMSQISDDFFVEYQTINVINNKGNLTVVKDGSSQIPLNTVFVETPLILEFKKFMNRGKGKTPYHIESLLNILDTDYSFTDEEQDKFIKSFTQKSKEIIKGDIESSGDSFIFNKEGDKNYDIVNASSGTKSIGLLQYLVTNKALKKDSVLYWEEPEVHLHPEWQLRMVELFIELMNAGVKIVFSTHSPYMCDYLNAISQKKGFDDRVSFNLFEESEGVVKNYILESDEDWNKIQAELLDPLEEIMWEYI